MDAKKLSERWQEQSQEMSQQVAHWRVDHPTTTLAEIERTVDEHICSFAQAKAEMADQWGIHLSPATVRRQALRGGEGSVQVELQRAHPLVLCPEERPAERMIMSNDGAMVSLRGKTWGEVRLVVVGLVQQERTAKGSNVHSYSYMKRQSRKKANLYSLFDIEGRSSSIEK